MYTTLTSARRSRDAGKSKPTPPSPRHTLKADVYLKACNHLCQTLRSIYHKCATSQICRSRNNHFPKAGAGKLRDVTHRQTP